ncbi:MAG: M3 family oligoendopeptidase [Pseudomonadales bacterium]
MKFDNTAIYTDLTDPGLEQDMLAVNSSRVALAEQATGLDVSKPQKLAAWLRAYDQADVTLSDIETFTALILSVDTTVEAAEEIESRCNKLSSELAQSAVPVADKLALLSDDEFQLLVESDELQAFKFKLEHERALVAHRLSVGEETLLQKMAEDGLNAWGEQYFKLAGTIQANIDGEEVGLASAFNQTLSADRTVRESAWKGTYDIWSKHQDSVVAGLNAINGWRLNECERRSNKKEMHYLDVACHQSHIERSTLSTLMTTAFENRNIGHRAIKGMLSWNGIEDGKPWDLMAPPKVESDDVSPIAFDECMKIICEAFAEFDPEMAEFAQMMADKGWIDGEPTPNRATGAFCDEFFGAGEPRVFMTYDGSMGNVLTLAHEIGHAWHAWLLRDMAHSEKNYPMTLAETASIFAETIVRQSILRNATSNAQKRDILWQEAEAASSLLINIPARFEFEQSFVEARKQSKVSSKAARSLMHDAWAKWYGDAITEYDDLFWASKLHFSIADIGFYNYPYLFGYLFSLGVYAQKDKQGDNFRFAYRELLRDTGRMTAEQCIQKHLGRDIRDASFWQDSMDIVNDSITAFEELI